MKNLLISELEKFGYPVFLQGSLNDDEAYPETFITFFTDYTVYVSYYDNDVYSVEWNISVIIYSSIPQIVNEKPIEIIKALKKAGFIPQGKGQDVFSDEQTHTGWAMDFKYLEHIRGVDMSQLTEITLSTDRENPTVLGRQSRGVYITNNDGYFMFGNKVSPLIPKGSIINYYSIGSPEQNFAEVIGDENHSIYYYSDNSKQTEVTSLYEVCRNIEMIIQIITEIQTNSNS